EDMQSGPSGPQLYLLSEEGYRELKSIQAMLTLIARIARGEEDNANGKAMLTISRSDMSYYFLEISSLIGDALDRLGKENVMSKQSWMWQ
ncbi:MAG TPA: hypothetical protein VL997_00125, partial [Dyella sp.]|nr:hypothetical protein [Dyella sp.]